MGFLLMYILTLFSNELCWCNTRATSHSRICVPIYSSCLILFIFFLSYTLYIPLNRFLIQGSVLLEPRQDRSCEIRNKPLHGSGRWQIYYDASLRWGKKII